MRGGYRPGSGRKPKGADKRVHLNIYVTPATRDLLMELSKYNKVSMSQTLEMLLFGKTKKDFRKKEP